MLSNVALKSLKHLIERLFELDEPIAEVRFSLISGLYLWVAKRLQKSGRNEETTEVVPAFGNPNRGLGL